MEITPIIKEDFIVLDGEETISEMIGKMKQFEKRAVLVFRNNKYVGLVEKKRLLRSKFDSTEAKVKHYVQKSPIVSEHEDLISTAYLMYQSGLEVLPVERDKKIIGVLSALDVAKLALELPEIKNVKVLDLKLVRPTKIDKDDPVSLMVDIMYKERVDYVPVFDKGKLYGIVSYKDFLRKYLNWSPRRDFSVKFNKMASTKSAEADVPALGSLPVGSFSTNDNLLTIDEGGKIKEAVNLMYKNTVFDILVMKGNEFKSLLTVKNVLRYLGSLKIPQNFNIQFVGLNQVHLEPYQKYNLQKICSNEAFKLQRKIKNEFVLVVHLKEYEQGGSRKEAEGKQHKYSVHIRVEYPGQILTVSQDDWDLETALHKTFENAKNALEKKFKTYAIRGIRKKEW